MIWWMGYGVLLLALFVRLQAPDGAPRAPLHAGPDEPLGLVRAHHAVFYAILLGTPVEALVLGGAGRGRVLGLLGFALGVALYRIAGPYRWLRHPMYLGQALIAVGAPLTLGARWVVWLALPALAILVVRARREDAALARTFPEHARWAAHAKRLVPFVF